MADACQAQTWSRCCDRRRGGRVGGRTGRPMALLADPAESFPGQESGTRSSPQARSNRSGGPLGYGDNAEHHVGARQVRNY